MTMETPPDTIKTKSYYKKDAMLNLDKALDKAKQVKKMYTSNKQHEYDPYLQDFGSKQVGINQALNDRMKVIEMQNSALNTKIKKLEEMIAKMSINTNQTLEQKLEEMTDKLDDLKSRIDLLDE